MRAAMALCEVAPPMLSRSARRRIRLRRTAILHAPVHTKQFKELLPDGFFAVPLQLDKLIPGAEHAVLEFFGAGLSYLQYCN